METDERVTVPGCKHTFVREIESKDSSQVMLVDVLAGGEIPLHTHNSSATMVILSGKAKALGHKSRYVKKGDVIVKASNEPHGFTDITDDFRFVSISYGEGIKQESNWDMKYT